MSRQILALDIRNTSIAAVLLSTGLKSSTIEACAWIPLPDESAEEQRLSAGLTALLQQHHMPENATVVACLPSDRAIYRNVQVPFKEDKKIRQVLPFELEPNLPFAADDLIIDYQKSVGADQVKLLTTSLDRRHLETLMAAMSTARLHPQMVVPGDFPLALSLTAYCDQMDEQALLLNVGQGRTTLFAFKNRNIELVRSLPSDITSESGVEALALKIRQTLTAIADAGPDGYAPKTLYLSGPGARDDSSRDRLARALDMTPQPLDLRSMAPKLDAPAAPDRWQPWIFDNALALALIEAEGRPCPNFHHSSSSLRKFWTTYRPYIGGPAVLAAVVLLLSLAGVLYESHLLQTRVDQVNARIEALFAETFPQSRRVGNALDQMKSELKKVGNGGLDAEDITPRVRTIDILLQLSQLIPKEVNVVFSRLVLGNEGLTLSGQTADYNTVDDVKGRLENSDLFRQVTIASSNMDKSGSVRFKLKIDL